MFAHCNRVPFVRDGLLNTCDQFKHNIDSPMPLKDANILEVGCGGGILSEVNILFFFSLQ